MGNPNHDPKNGEFTTGAGGGGGLPGHAKTLKSPMRGLTGEVIVEPLRSMVGREGKDVNGNLLSRAALARAITNRDSAALIGRAYNEATHANTLSASGAEGSIWDLGGSGHNKKSVILQPPPRGGKLTAEQLRELRKASARSVGLGVGIGGGERG